MNWTGVCAMNRDALLDELRRVELEVVEGERRLADQEALLIEMRREQQDVITAEAELETAGVTVPLQR